MSREAQAGKWFARMRASDAAADRAKFDAWMADPENATAYAEAEKRWAALDVNVAGRIRAFVGQARMQMPHWISKPNKLKLQAKFYLVPNYKFRQTSKSI